MKGTYKISILVIVFVLLATASNSFAKVRTVTIRVQGLTCEMCAASLQPELKSTNGVLGARVDFKLGTAWIKYDDTKITVTGLRNVIKDAGFKAIGKG